MLLRSNQKLFGGFVILIKLEYSDHVAYISFIFLRLFHLRNHEIHPSIFHLGPAFKYHKQPTTAIADDTRWRRRITPGGEGEMSRRKVFKKEGKFSVTKLLCCHVDGEKLCVPYFHSPRLEPRGEETKNFFRAWHFRHYLLIYHYNRKWDQELQSSLHCLMRSSPRRSVVHA